MKKIILAWLTDLWAKHKKTIIYLCLFLIVLTGAYFAGRGCTLKENKENLNNILALRDSITTYKKKINGLEVQVFEKGALILSQQEAIKTGLIEKKALKKLNLKQANELVSIKSLVSILRDSVSHTGIIVYIDTNKQKPAILLPFSFYDSDKFHSLTGMFDITGKMNYNLSLPVDLDVYTGIGKDKKLKAVITTTNPYVKINDILSVKMDTPAVKKFGIGIFGGYGIGLGSTIMFQPVVGIGLTYTIIRF